MNRKKTKKQLQQRKGDHNVLSFVCTPPHVYTRQHHTSIGSSLLDYPILKHFLFIHLHSRQSFLVMDAAHRNKKKLGRGKIQDHFSMAESPSTSSYVDEMDSSEGE